MRDKDSSQLEFSEMNITDPKSLTLWASPGAQRGKEKKVKVLFAQSCIRSVVHSLGRVRLFVTPCTEAFPGSSVHGILQARILEWVAIPFSKRSS